MKTNYFSKVEDKYVFNLSLIFWHIFIVLSSLAIVISIAVFLWTLVPPVQKKVLKQAYPAKKQYPAPIKVSLNELNLTNIKNKEVPHVAPRSVQTTPRISTQQSIGDTTGEYGYKNSLTTLKTLIPPSKYSWKGSGYWNYPYGKQYWTYYKQERYRQWIVSRYGVNDRLKYNFKKIRAKNFSDKKQLLDGYISVVKLLPEEKRLKALQYLMNNVSNNEKQNIAVYKSLTKVLSKMKQIKQISYLNKLAKFGKVNPNDGVPFINYTAKIINNFDATQRVSIINSLVNSYYNYFNQNFVQQQEATDLFLPLVAQIKAKQQTKAIIKYYRLFLTKNYNRNRLISQINSEHQQAINNIDNQYHSEQLQARHKYYIKKEAKQKLRDKSLYGIAGGIVLIVLIASILVFLSIQRSIKKIEEKLTR
jgi:uncharacterized tellurite resistance protein B-like protein